MPNVLRKLTLVDRSQNERIRKTIDIDDSSCILWRKIGNVELLILLKPNIVKYVCNKEITDEVKVRLENLGTVNEIFSLGIGNDAHTIEEFSDAACLADIMVLREDCWFDPEHFKLLALDVLTGILALHRVGLKRNSFSVKDVLLVWRNNTFNFQIAGIENCTCVGYNDPVDNRELDSLVEILHYTKDRMEEKNKNSIKELESRLKKLTLLDKDGLEKEITNFRDPKVLYRRKELGIYVQAVRILGTTVGGALPRNGEAKFNLSATDNIF
ncbi:hypothetical protein ACJQWK_02645 [Exserohilum turcicum]